MAIGSRHPGFYKWPLAQRRDVLSTLLGCSPDVLGALDPDALTLTVADKLIENVVGVLGIPVGLGLNLLVNGEDVLVPMAVEEPSVVAAFSNAAKTVRAGGGFTADADPSHMIAQLQMSPTSAEAADRALAGLIDASEQIEAEARAAADSMARRGGGLVRIERRRLEDPEGGPPLVIVHLVIDVLEAMGANAVNHVAETVAPRVAAAADCPVNLRILSNLTDQRLARASCRVPVDGFAPGVAERIADADRFARIDPYRAATHNKGIFNGIDAVALATGNDWRALEAGGHAWAARSGTYRGLTRWVVEDDYLLGAIEMPMAVGTVGGATRSHPSLGLLRSILGAESARKLAGIFAAVGLAQNLAALRALTSEGIQRGHMRLHARQLALAAGARPGEVDAVVQAAVDRGRVSAEAKGRPAFGGTPSDAAVIEAIQELKARGLRVLFYPFILMDIPSGGGAPDPWSDASDQPPFPWRGRITLENAPGRPGSTDQTSAAAAEVSAFFGGALASDFAVTPGAVGYSGPPDFRYRRFILHCAALAAAAGGVDAFAIGSEMRSLTQIRDSATSYPAVAELRALAAEARSLLGGNTKLTYAADWSEYFGHQPADGSGDVLFHLDRLWADPEIDAVSIDAYFPLSDWRDESGVDDEGAASIYDIDYLQRNIEGGEHFDWFYASAEDRATGTRSPIEDGAYGEPWVFRAKDLRNWWSNPHYDRPAGVRSETPTAWAPQSKPIWLTEIGCPAVDKGANQPNVFFDPKSSESALPYFSSGARDDEMQKRYLQAALSYWQGAANPVSSVYGGPMLAMDQAHVWTWDARPWPDFPTRTDVWSDGAAHGGGHWVTGRLGSASLPDLVAAICAEAGLTDVDVSALAGVVDGMMAERPTPARDLIEPLMLAFGFDAVQSAGALCFAPRGGTAATKLTNDEMVVDAASDRATPPLERQRVEASTSPRAARVAFVSSGDDYRAASVEAQREGAIGAGVATGDLPIAMGAARAQAIADRILAEAWTARERAGFALPPSRLAIEPSDIVAIETPAGEKDHRIARISEDGSRRIEAVQVDRGHAIARVAYNEALPPPSPPVSAPPVVVAMDLPLLTGNESPHALSFAAFLDPWPGPLTIWRSASDDGYASDAEIRAPATVGRTLSSVPAAAPNLWTRDLGLEIELSAGALSSRSQLAVLNGANAIALETPSGDWEVAQFETATLIGDDRYRLSPLLRGQAGTEGLIADPLPAGARVVALNGATTQSTAPASTLGLRRFYRIGASSRPVSAATHALIVDEALGAGLRPYAPAHLQVATEADGKPFGALDPAHADRWRQLGGRGSAR